MFQTNTLGEILARKSHDVYSISPQQTVHDAVTALVEHGVGSLVVTSDDKVVGIITERDLLRENARRHQEIDTIPIESVMTKSVIIGRPEDPVEEAMWLMTEQRIRHLPVLDGPKLVGMISIGDLVKTRLDDVTSEKEHLIRYVTDQYPG